MVGVSRAEGISLQSGKVQLLPDVVRNELFHPSFLPPLKRAASLA